MFSIPITIKFDRDALTTIDKIVLLGNRVMDYLGSKQQSEIDQLTSQVAGVLGRFRSSQQALQGALTNNQK